MCHQTLKTIIAVSLRENPSQSFEEVSPLIQHKCAAAQFAIRTTIHSQTKLSPGEMAFGRNILYPFSKQVNWDELLRNKQEIVDKANIKETLREGSLTIKKEI